LNWIVYWCFNIHEGVRTLCPKDYNVWDSKNLYQVGQKEFGIQSLAFERMRANVKRNVFNNGGGDTTLKKKYNFQTSGIFRIFLKAERPQPRDHQSAPNGQSDVEKSMRHWKWSRDAKVFENVSKC
jgi:hypothetical protein